MDLKLENGDLVLSNKVEVDESLLNITIYDLISNSREEELHTLVRRTFITPLGYIRLRIIDALGTRKIDYEYGDGIYLTLAQPMKTTLLQRVEEYIKACIEQLPPPITINRYQIQVMNIDAVRIVINYSLNHEDVYETSILIEV